MTRRDWRCQIHGSLCLAPKGSATQERETNPEGAFVFRLSKPGKYTITAQAGAFKSITKPVFLLFESF